MFLESGHTALMQAKITYDWWALLCTKMRCYHVCYIIGSFFFLFPYALHEEIRWESTWCEHMWLPHGEVAAYEMWGHWKGPRHPFQKDLSQCCFWWPNLPSVSSQWPSTVFPLPSKLLSCDNVFFISYLYFPVGLWNSFQCQLGDIRF